MSILNDVYYSKKYASLYLKNGEEIFEFSYKNNGYIFYQLSIKRPILKIGKYLINEGFYDLETPYGYGGLYVNTDDIEFLQKAFAAYQERCNKEKIIAEFSRFHPFNTFAQEHKDYFDMCILDRDVVVVDLVQSKEERWSKYSSNTRNILRRAEKTLTFSKSDEVEIFQEMYYKTMQRNNADKFFYFDKEYFINLMSMNNVSLYKVAYQENIISMAFFMFGEDFVHYHLSANDLRFSKLNSNYFILENSFELSRKSLKKYFLLGGGKTSTRDDSLFKFKNKFSDFYKPFYIAGKIFNYEKYNEYNDLWRAQGVGGDVRYFLKYRLDV